MVITKEQTQSYIQELGKTDKDSGSPEVQVAILTQRINYLTEHLKKFRKDFSTRLGMLKMVGRRRKLLNYLKAHRTPEAYKALQERLGLRK